MRISFFFEKNYIPWAFSFQTLTSPESCSFSLPAPRSIFLSLASRTRLPLPLSRAPHPRPRLLPFPSLLYFKGKPSTLSGLRRPRLPQAGHRGLQTILSLALQGPKERDLNLLRHLGPKTSSPRGRFQRRMVERDGGQRVSHRLRQTLRHGPALQESRASSPSLHDLLGAGQSSRGGAAPARGRDSRAAARGRCAGALEPRHVEGSLAVSACPGRPRKGPPGTGRERAEEVQGL